MDEFNWGISALCLNKFTVRVRAGYIVLEIGSDLAQNLEKVA